MKIHFLSKDANWQHYRNETLTYLGKKYNANVEILTTGQLRPDIADNDVVKYKIFSNWFSNKDSINFFPSALLYIIRNRPDCVLALNNTSNLTEYLGVLICRILGIRFVWWTHGYDHKPVKNGLKRKFRHVYTRIFLKLGNAVVAFSQAGKDYLIKEGINAAKIFVAPNTLDTEKLSVVREELKSNFSREEFIAKNFVNVPLSSRFLLFSGRINHYKKVHNLVESLSLILKSHSNVHIIVIGEGPKKEEVIKLAHQLGIADHVHFKGGIFDPKEVGRYFMLSDLFVIPGLVGLAIVHAFSFGKPLITEDIDYHSPEIQYLKDGINGYMIPEDDIKKMAETIIKLLDNNELLLKLSEGALIAARNDASISNMVEAMYMALTKI